ncbi:helix-turn-helix domain-containing protein [Catelliglobosispora koreensis]|uniref:helix-turn-helix domain-containing protein n=1 Tax=Catelliglobosispora koreensis TaxID=129052 RepID=UPI00035F2D8A|nr:XRE family transcriptional regulator [Catelliglobosispora koreensis]
MSSPLATIAEALRRERARTGISLTELARRAGIAKSTLSQLEAGSGNPGVETLWALAVALNVPFSRLIETPATPVRIIRAGEGVRYPAEEANFAGTLLASSPPGVSREIYQLHIEPGATRHAESHIPGSVEHVIVAKGRLRTGPTGSEVELAEGDYATFPGDIPHIYEALEPHTWAVLVMEHR